MSYRDRLLNGSFKGVPFRTPVSEREGGRRGVLHEYPARDDYTTQDLGKAPTRFNVTAVIYGADYDKTRDALIAALESGGPGKLVHRYFGEFDAELEPGQRYKLTESDEQGGKAVFTIPFIRASRSKAPVASVDTAQLVAVTASAARTYARAKFEGDVDQHGPEWLRDQMLGAVNTVNSKIRAVTRQANNTLGYTSGVQAAINNFGNAAAQLIASPTLVFQIADNIMDIHAELFQSFDTIGQSFKDTISAFRGKPSLEAARALTSARKVAKTLTGTLSGLMALEDVAPDETTPTTLQSTKNQQAVISIAKLSAAIDAADNATGLPYDTRDTATTTRDILADAILGLADATDDDNLRGSLLDLRVAVIDHLTQLSGNLPAAARFVPRGSSMPALLIAHMVHGDARRCDEIVMRNNLRHPGFVAPTQSVEVVSDA